MLKTRIIPVLLFKDTGLVKGEGFNSWRRIGAAMQAVRVFNLRGVDELVFLDITATAQQRPPDIEQISELAAECFMPLAVGGGIRNLTDIENLLRAGADKVVLNSCLFTQPQIVAEAARAFGRQALVAALDVRQGDNGYRVFSHNASQDTGHDPVRLAKQLQEQGIGEIMLTRVEYDGMMQGYDIPLLQAVSKAVSLPVIAAGGAGNYQHMLDVLQATDISALAAGAMFQFTEATPLGAKEYLAAAGFPMRLPKSA